MGHRKVVERHREAAECHRRNDLVRHMEEAAFHLRKDLVTCLHIVVVQQEDITDSLVKPQDRLEAN